jgi:uncharacterized protein
MAKKRSNKQTTKSQPVKKRIKPIYKVVAVVALLALVFFLAFPGIFKKERPVDPYAFKKEGELTFYTDSKPVVKIDIEIADTEYERQLGLMKRKSMEENHGMLFIFPDETVRSFWMRNTFIPLDMIFVNTNNEIVTIHKNTRVLSDSSYPSSAPAVYVVEVVGGFTDKYNISEGDKISWMGTKL